MADQWALPESDVLRGEWTTEAAGTTNLFASINDDATSISDVDFIKSDVYPSHDIYKTALSAIGTPSAGTVTLHLRTRLAPQRATYITWIAYAGAASYTVEISTDLIVWTPYVVGNVLFTSIGLAPGTYYVRVRAYDAVGTLLSTYATETVTVT